MTSTDFDTAVDQALLISHDWDPACEMNPCRFGRPSATHCVISTQCGDSSFSCTDCIEIYASFLRELERDGGYYTYDCAACGAVGLDSRGVRIEPLP